MKIVYGLADPRDGVVRYVGATRQILKRRLAQHVKTTRSDPRSLWIRGLLSEGVTPVIVVLGEPTDDWASVERRLIAEMPGLLNRNAGGDGTDAHTSEVRLRMSQARAGHGVTEETKRKIGASNAVALMGNIPSAEARAKLSEANRRAWAEGRRKSGYSIEYREWVCLCGRTMRSSSKGKHLKACEARAHD